jgi:hypothetical protein
MSFLRVKKEQKTKTEQGKISYKAKIAIATLFILLSFREKKYDGRKQRKKMPLGKPSRKKTHTKKKKKKKTNFFQDDRKILKLRRIDFLSFSFPFLRISSKS